MRDFGVVIQSDDHNWYRQYKEEMVSGFTGLPDGGKHRMLLLCVYYNEVFFLAQLVTLRLRLHSPWFNRMREDPLATNAKVFFNATVDILLSLWP